jgi:hypothetical protein
MSDSTNNKKYSIVRLLLVGGTCVIAGLSTASNWVNTQQHQAKQPTKADPRAAMTFMTSMMKEQGTYQYQCPAKLATKEVALSKPQKSIAATKSITATKAIALNKANAAKQSIAVNKSGIKPEVPLPENTQTILALFESAESAEGVAKQLGALPHRRILGQAVLVAIAPEQVEATQQSLKQYGATKILTSQPDEPQAITFFLKTEIPQQDDIVRLNHQLEGYFSAPPEAYLTAPWQQATGKAKQRAIFEKSRYTHLKLRENTLRMMVDRMDGGSFAKQWGKSVLGIVTRNRKTLAEVSQEQGEKQMQAIQAAIDHLIDTEQDKIDLPTIELYQALWQEQLAIGKEAIKLGKVSEEQQARIQRRVLALGARMGQLPVSDLKPEERSLGWSAQGSAQFLREKEAPHIELLRFQNPYQGLPAMAQYLCENGASGISYDAANLQGMQIN